MAYENINVSESNFCIGPQAGTYCTVNTAAAAPVMQVRNNSGTLIRSYSFYPEHTIRESGGAVINGVVKSLKYVGPTNLSSYYSGLIFYTLESYYTTYWTSVIRQWKLNSTLNRLELYASITKNETSNISYKSNAMAIEYIQTSFFESTAAYSGDINFTTSSGICVGDMVVLGPSTDTDNLNAIEYAYVKNIDGNKVTIITYDGYTPPLYDYRKDDPIIVFRDIFIFSDPKDSASPGVVSRLNQTNYGDTIEIDSGGLYSNVGGADWHPGYGYLVFSRIASIYMTDPNGLINKYKIIKSMNTFNFKTDNYTSIPIYEIGISGNTVYKLQKETIRRNDSGVSTVYSWLNYNYQVDSLAPYCANISIVIFDAAIQRLGSRNLSVKVIDQFGVALQNKTVTFSSQSGDTGATFTYNNLLTDINGMVYNEYNSGSSYTGDVTIIVKTNGCSEAVTGSQYIYCNMKMKCYSSFSTISSLIKTTKFYNNFTGTVNSNLINTKLISYAAGIYVKMIEVNFISLNYNFITSKSSTASSNFYITQGFSKDNSTFTLKQQTNSNNLDIDQVRISRHVGGTPNVVTVSLDQYNFISDALPAFWSTKNPISTDMWIKIRPFAADLDISTFVYMVREISYAGDSGWINITNQGTITNFDAGGGLLGIEFFRVMPDESWYFHYGGKVYVHIEVYDKALIPNKIVIDYWFILIHDFIVPYILNEIPARGEYNVPIDGYISFDIVDSGAGVDMNTFEMFLDQRRALNYTYTPINGGYHVVYVPDEPFYYGRSVQITVRVSDVSDSNNFLNDGWEFYVESSKGPWFNRNRFNPGLCVEGLDRKTSNISVQVYGIGNGVDENSIEMHIGGVERNINIIPVIYREKME